MSTIVLLLLLLQTGVGPVLSQTTPDFKRSRFTDYGDFNQYSSEETDQSQDSSVGLQKASFFDDDGSIIGNENSYISQLGGKVSNKNHYFSNSDRRVIVPSSLRELEESYIRSLSSPSRKQFGLDPFGESGSTSQSVEQQKDVDGVENYASFIMTNRRYDKSLSKEQLRANQIQSAPITYGFPLLSRQMSTANSLDAQFDMRQKLKQRGKVYDYREKNIVPNFPEFGDRPPIPQEPDLPSAEEPDTLEEATRKPPIHILPTPSNIQNFYNKPLTSPPPVFDRNFPEPILQRGFIPSFGPPTKEPFVVHPQHSPPPEKVYQNILAEQDFNFVPQQIEEITTSPVPVLRPEYPVNRKEENILPDEASSIAPEFEESPKQGQVYKHISVHVPPEELEVSSPKVIKIGKKQPDKHIKFIFIKPPDTPRPRMEVDIPSRPQEKTLVYVLSESGGVRTPIKLVTPAPLKPAPPQVFFFRYTDTSVEASHPPPSTTPAESRVSTQRPTTTPLPIKQLASPHDPDATLLRSAPAPVLPTYSAFSTPNSISRAAYQSLNSPSTYTTTARAVYNADISTSPKSNFHELTTSTPISNNINNNHLISPSNNADFNRYLPPSSSTIASPPHQAPTNDAYPKNYYTTLYNLYPPPRSSPNLYSLYYNQINHPQQFQSHFYPQLRGLKGPGPETAPSSIQGLYTAAPYLKDLPGSVTFNSLAQNPDGNNLPRSTRNYAMMTYAPRYMPSASEHVPVFTSPEAFLKSLLGDSYRYYNNEGNYNNQYIENSTNNAQPFHASLEAPTQPPVVITTSTSTTPAPPTPVTTSLPTQPPYTQAQHHIFPLLLNFENIQNFSTTDAHNKALTLLIGNPYGLSPITNNANIQIRNPTISAAAAAPINLSSYSRPPPSSTTTTTPTPQPRISWTPTTTQPRISWTPTNTQSPHPNDPKPTRKEIYQLPMIVYNNEKPTLEQTQTGSVTTGESVASHFNNLFQAFHENPAQAPRTNHPASQKTSRTSSEYIPKEISSSGSTETVEEEERNDSSGSGSFETEGIGSGSGEEIVPIYFEPTKANPPRNSTIIYVKNSNSVGSVETSDSKRPPKRSGRKRVNPAHVKPGRRLRKVKKKPRNNRRRKGNSTNSSSGGGDVINFKKETHAEKR